LQAARQLAGRIFDLAQSVAASAPPASVLAMLAAFAALGVYSEPLLSALLRTCSGGGWRAWQPPQLAGLVHGLARLGCRPSEAWLEGFVGASAAAIGSWGLPELERAASGLVVLRWAPGAAWLRGAEARLDELAAAQQLEAEEGQQGPGEEQARMVAVTVKSLAVLGGQQARQWLAVLQRTGVTPWQARAAEVRRQQLQQQQQRQRLQQQEQLQQQQEQLQQRQREQLQQQQQRQREQQAAEARRQQLEAARRPAGAAAAAGQLPDLDPGASIDDMLEPALASMDLESLLQQDAGSVEAALQAVGGVKPQQLAPHGSSGESGSGAGASGGVSSAGLQAVGDPAWAAEQQLRWERVAGAGVGGEEEAAGMSLLYGEDGGGWGAGRGAYSMLPARLEGQSVACSRLWVCCWLTD
jgi:hypothetical protein